MHLHTDSHQSAHGRALDSVTNGKESHISWSSVLRTSDSSSAASPCVVPAPSHVLACPPLPFWHHPEAYSEEKRKILHKAIKYNKDIQMGYLLMFSARGWTSLIRGSEGLRWVASSCRSTCKTAWSSIHSTTVSSIFVVENSSCWVISLAMQTNPDSMYFLACKCSSRVRK